MNIETWYCKYNKCGCCSYCPIHKREECDKECKEVPDTCDGVEKHVCIDEEEWARLSVGGI